MKENCRHSERSVALHEIIYAIGGEFVEQTTAVGFVERKTTVDFVEQKTTLGFVGIFHPVTRRDFFCTPYRKVMNHFTDQSDSSSSHEL